MSIPWIIYLVFVLVLTFGGSAIFYTSTRKVSDYADFVISLAILAGIIGFVFDQPILDEFYWKVFFVFTVFWNFLYNYVLAVLLKAAQVGIPKKPTDYIIGTALMLPAFIGLYLYAFNSSQLWIIT